VEGSWATSSGVPTEGRSPGKSGQTAFQLQRLNVAHRIRVAQLHPGPEPPGCGPIRLGSGILALKRSTECQGKAFADTGQYPQWGSCPS
jgi:hypothetical protein